MSPQQKRTFRVVGGIVVLYLYLNFFRLEVNLYTLFADYVNAFYYVFVLFKPGLVARDVGAFLLDAVILTVGFYLWAAFYSQFVLPVKTLKERSEIISRVFKSFSSEKGEAVFIQNGEVIRGKQEENRRGAGVILLDSASAAVLHNKGAYTRAIGPGLVFTNPSEKITKAVDLHNQVRILGPRENEDIFEDPEEDDFESFLTQERRKQTSGLTRDGIEVVPNIIAIFRLDAKAGDGNSEFGYQAESVTKAIQHEAMSVNGEGSEVELPWDWLPAHMGVDLWREYLRKYTLNELFDITQHQVSQPYVEQGLKNPGQTVFEYIVSMINKRMNEEWVVKLNEFGKPLNEVMESREYNLLKKHGIKMLALRVDDLRLKDDHKLIDRWRATWLQRALNEKNNIDKLQEIARQRAADAAVIEFTNTIVGPLYNELIEIDQDENKVLDSSATLQALLRATRTNIIRNTSLNKPLADERAGLDSIIEFIQNYENGDFEEPQPKNGSI